MFKKLEVKTLVMGIVMGGMVSFGTYFLLPPPDNAYANPYPDVEPQSVYRLFKYDMNHGGVVEWRSKVDPTILCIGFGKNIHCVRDKD